MLRRLTVYEIRNIIATNFKEMCSSSMGSIQAALKKLLAADMVVCSERVENSVNKKRYSITDKGRETFMVWLQVPADMTNAKNMEIGKLLFMGLVPEDKRLTLIDGIIANLEAALVGLSALWNSMQGVIPAKLEQATNEWAKDPEYLQGILNAAQNLNAAETADGICTFETAALQYGIDSMRFNIDWFKRLREKMKECT